MQKIIIATHNRGKLEEFQRMLAPLGYEAVSADEAGCPDEIEENGATFAENAILKAKAVCEAAGLPAMGDDSGLCVDALGGGPGVYTARYAGEHGTPEMCIEKLLRALDGVPVEERGAYFACAIALCYPGGGLLLAEGRCDGSIAFQKDGGGGFGYDPIFLYEGRSFAALSPEEKDAVSHRGIALRKIAELLKQETTNIL
ncbi:MAG TPA: RdgB/HAM1 family non-canonical purine NTP pyrophosphatase [Oscillospiraceae bacterium]|nr:RdgB/HAM1 family non-canonical purine NTP pyrophosphatase [Oscillospiraceae bacterium]HPW00812.1 RdgB/HAM1 family non-canonical purine NTP pyrophosphatase [Oscillospiraceae bacterium]